MSSHNHESRVLGVGGRRIAVAALLGGAVVMLLVAAWWVFFLLADAPIPPGRWHVSKDADGAGIPPDTYRLSVELGGDIRSLPSQPLVLSNIVELHCRLLSTDHPLLPGRVAAMPALRSVSFAAAESVNSSDLLASLQCGAQLTHVSIYGGVLDW